MKRYLVFSGLTYYPDGGWSDFDSDHDTLEEANEARKDKHSKFGWSEVVDTESMRSVIVQSENSPVILDPELLHLDGLTTRDR